MDDAVQAETERPVPSLRGAFPSDRLSPLILRFLNRLKRTGKSPNTISSYRNDLNLFGEFLIETRLDPQSYASPVCEEWVRFLQAHNRKSDASLRRAQMSVRTFMHFLMAEKIIERSPFLEVKSPRQPSHALLTILPEHYRKLSKGAQELALKGDDKAVRDWALLLVLGDCGLKATEAAGLTWSDVLVTGSGTGPAGGSLRIRGANERLVPLLPDGANALQALRSVRRSLGLGDAPADALFFGYTNVSRRQMTPSLHRHGIKFIIYEVCEEILGVPYNSESLRNRAILHWLEQGIPTQKVCELAGYSSMNSLERFSPSARGLRRPHRKTRESSAEG